MNFFQLSIISTEADHFPVPDKIFPKNIAFVFEKVLENEVCTAHIYNVCTDVSLDFCRFEAKNAKLKYPQFDFIFAPQFKKLNQNCFLLCMDMDSTLIQVEVIDEVAKLFNIEEEIKKITELAMLGKLDFKESLKKRVEKLKGFKISDFNKIDLPLTSGGEELIKTLKKNNFKIALITGGFSYFAHKLQEKLSIDHIVCNEFEVSKGILTGNVKEPIIDGEAKKTALLNLASHYQISIENTVALGDGANDIPMLQASGTGIAFNAKPKTKELAPCVLDIKDLSAVLLALGIS